MIYLDWTLGSSDKSLRRLCT